MAPGQFRPSHEQPSSAMNPLYDYRLPPGLGMAVHGSTEDTSTASEIMLHTASRPPATRTGAASFRSVADYGSLLTQPSVYTHSCAGTHRQNRTACELLVNAAVALNSAVALDFAVATNPVPRTA